MGYITLLQETEVEIEVNDIISNLGDFNSDDLEDIQEEIEYQLTKRHQGKKNDEVLKASTLDEEYKIKILKEMFDKFSWEELEDIKKKIM